MTMSKENVDKGVAIMKKMMGEEHVGNLAKGRGRFPEWQEWTQGFLFGQVWSRPELDLRTRSLCNVAALTAMTKPDQLATHVKGAINNGAKPQEIIEVVMQMGFYSGWPNCGIALKVVDRVLTEMGL